MNSTKGAGTITSVSANGTLVSNTGAANIPAASTSVYGVAMLIDSVISNSTVLAATANSVYTLKKDTPLYIGRYGAGSVTDCLRAAVQTADANSCKPRFFTFDTTDGVSSGFPSALSGWKMVCVFRAEINDAYLVIAISSWSNNWCIGRYSYSDNTVNWFGSPST